MDAVNKSIGDFDSDSLKVAYNNLKMKVEDEDYILEQFLNLFYLKDSERLSLEEMKQLFKKEPEESNIQFCTK